MAEKRGLQHQDSELALSEVVGFILLLGVIVAAFALWMVYIVPINGREAEITQMNAVKDRFTDYKISLDSLWINTPNSDSPYYDLSSRTGVTLSTSLNLGTGGGNTQASGLFLPMLNPIASSAVLAVDPPLDFMNVTSSGGYSKSYLMSSLKYQSQNYYWIQQTYYYQSGGVFLTQDNGSTCRISPPISFVSNNDNTRSVTIIPIRLYGVGSMGGNGPVRIDTRLKPMMDPDVIQSTWVNTSVTVSDYNSAKMWLDVFNTSRRNGQIFTIGTKEFGISPKGPGRATAFMNITGPAVYLKIQPVEYDVTLNSIASGMS